MRWAERLAPAPMSRVAVVAPTWAFRRALVATAELGQVELEVLEVHDPSPTGTVLSTQTRHLEGAPPGPSAVLLAPDPPGPTELEGPAGAALRAGEAELGRRAAAAVTRGSVTAAVGWVPTASLPALADGLAPLGAAAVPLPFPPGADPPTLDPPGRVAESFHPLVDLYTTVPYRDLDPSAAAGITYVLMFGMMFGDVGHGAVLVAAGLALRTGRPAFLARFRRVWPFVAGAGLTSCGFGFAYGELFGPTGALPVLWLAPLERPTTLLAVAIGIGACLLGAAYAAGSVNRWREGGPRRAAVAASGLAGAALYTGAALVAGGYFLHLLPLSVVGIAVAVVGFLLVGAGFRSGAEPGMGGMMQTSVELFDTVVRLGSNVMSFARLAAFGMTHAALTGIVWSASVALWHKGPAGAVGAGGAFVLGNAAAFALEGLVAGVQAMRLEYYELFSRVFADQGRPFRPWHIPTARLSEEAECQCS